MRFLNAVGGGIVRRVDRDVALVEEEDGFETPVLIKECVVIESGRRQDDGALPVDKQEAARRAVRQSALVAPPDDDDEPELPLVETRTGERLGLYLAFVPETVSRLGSTTFETYLINDSNYYLDYTYAVSGETGEWNLSARGTIEPNVQVCIERFGQESVNRFGRVSVQALAYKRGKSYTCKEPVSALLRIDPVKFYKLHTFGSNEFFDEKAWVLPLVEGDLPVAEIPVDAKALEKAMHEKNTPPRPAKVSRPKAPKEGPVEGRPAYTRTGRYHGRNEQRRYVAIAVADLPRHTRPLQGGEGPQNHLHSRQGRRRAASRHSRRVATQIQELRVSGRLVQGVWLRCHAGNDKLRRDSRAHLCCHGCG